MRKKRKFNFWVQSESNFKVSLNRLELIRFDSIPFEKGEKAKEKGGGRGGWWREVVDWHPMIDNFVPLRLMLLSFKDTTHRCTSSTDRQTHRHTHSCIVPATKPITAVSPMSISVILLLLLHFLRSPTSHYPSSTSLQ